MRYIVPLLLLCGCMGPQDCWTSGFTDCDMGYSALYPDDNDSCVQSYDEGWEEAGCVVE